MSTKKTKPDLITISAGFSKIAETLETLIKNTPLPTVNMLSQEIIQTHERNNPECMTIACVTGFYLASVSDQTEYKTRPEGSNRRYLTKSDHTDPIKSKNGVELLAKNIGFKCAWNLRDWCSKNPELWGNENGDGLFFSETAYHVKGLHRAGRIDLKEIIDFFKCVANRINVKLEKVHQPGNPDYNE